MDIPTDASGGLHSEVLDLDLCMVGDEFRFREVDTGETIPDYIELEDMRRAATRRVAALEGALSRGARPPRSGGQGHCPSQE